MCDKCRGTGDVQSVEFVEHFGGGYRMPVWYRCDCLEDDRCPKCDADLVDSEDNPRVKVCPNCESEWEV